jgi:hypothetical protein
MGMSFRRQLFILAGFCFVIAPASCNASTLRASSLQPSAPLIGHEHSQSKNNDKISANVPPENEITFAPDSFVTAFDSYDAAPLAYRVYKSSNGEIVSVTSRTFNNADALAAYIKWQLREGTKIGERKPRLSTSKEKIGERILIVQRDTGQDGIKRTFTTLIWTEETTFHEISGPSVSFKTIAAMEKWIGVK